MTLLNFVCFSFLSDFLRRRYGAIGIRGRSLGPCGNDRLGLLHSRFFWILFVLIGQFDLRRYLSCLSVIPFVLTSNMCSSLFDSTMFLRRLDFLCYHSTSWQGQNLSQQE